MNKKLLLALIALFACAASINAQGRRGLRINEVMIANDSSIVDDYGQRSAWVELFNSTFAPLEISSVFITDDPANPTKYPVPIGDVNTKIPKRQHVVFWADGNPTKGTFHMNFILVPGKDNWIGIYDADGKTLIDEVTVPASLKANQSYARTSENQLQPGADAWEIRDRWTENPVTPSSSNKIKDTNDKVDMFAARDENGFGMTVMAMGIVFSALLLLSVCFYIISKIGERASKINKAKAHNITLAATDKESHPSHDSGEEIAAIVLALHEHLNTHDTENTVLTINKVKRAYSPWSSKIYNMREMPRR
ncbi:lamin tail domain-containing protein [Muribaculaceae bacterium Isolate-104 (HZI)]|jgi:sodium pump decarboxylase gamma subunit|nr:lamin tail domain-containing protein [Muribaculaceae bacterium Isolate-104 (HZI)]